MIEPLAVCGEVPEPDAIVSMVREVLAGGA